MGPNDHFWSKVVVWHHWSLFGRGRFKSSKLELLMIIYLTRFLCCWRGPPPGEVVRLSAMRPLTLYGGAGVNAIALSFSVHWLYVLINMPRWTLSFYSLLRRHAPLMESLPRRTPSARSRSARTRYGFHESVLFTDVLSWRRVRLHSIGAPIHIIYERNLSHMGRRNRA